MRKAQTESHRSGRGHRTCLVITGCFVVFVGIFALWKTVRTNLATSDTSLSPDAAYERLLAAFGTDASGQQQYPDDYAGISLTEDTLILYLTNTDSKTTEKYRAWAGNAACLVFKEGTCSYNALVQAVEPIVQSLQADGYTVAQYSVSETARRLSLTLADCSEAEAKAVEASLRESWQLPIMVSVGTTVQLADAD